MLLYDMQTTTRASPCFPMFHTFKNLTLCPALARNVAEQLIDKGLASVVRHKRDDEDRSPDFDKLVAAEHT